MTFHRLALLGLLAAALANASSLMITFSGNGSGSLGDIVFDSRDFDFIFFTSDTSALISPPCCPDTTTPTGTSATFFITGFLGGTFMGDQAVFVNPSELTAGIWHYNDADWLTLGNLAFGSFNLAANIGPLTGTISSLGSTFPTSGGTLALTSVSSLTFTEVLAAAVPEPSVLTMLGLGVGCLIAGRFRRRRKDR